MKKRLLAAMFLLLPAVLSAGDRRMNYPVTKTIMVTTHTATALTDPTLGIYSETIDLFPNSAFALWIGSNTTSLNGHGGLTKTGFPIKSSTTYTTDGTFTGTVYGMADGAAASTQTVNVIYWLSNELRNQ